MAAPSEIARTSGESIVDGESGVQSGEEDAGCWNWAQHRGTRSKLETWACNRGKQPELEARSKGTCGAAGVGEPLDCVKDAARAVADECCANGVKDVGSEGADAVLKGRQHDKTESAVRADDVCWNACQSQSRDW